MTSKPFLIRILSLSLIVLVASSCGKNSNQQGLASLVFNYLKHNDYEGYAKYIITHNEAMAMLNTLERSGQYTAYSLKKKARVKSVKQQMADKLKQQKSALEKNFNQIFDQGARNGITWSRAKFVKARIGPQEKVFQLEGLKQQHIYIVFKHNKKEYTLRLRNNVKVNRGWVVVDGFSWVTPLKVK